MELGIDLEKEYGIVLEGGGAKGAYQIGAWKALREAGIKISAVAGTSVGALNGALMCMDQIERAEEIWKNICYSKVMDVDDELMTQMFSGSAKLHDSMQNALRLLGEGGADITPLKNLISEYIDEEMIRKSPVAFYLLTFSISELKELDLDAKELPDGLLADFLLASAYLPVFKKERLHGKNYMDGGMFNNVPLESLVKRGYQDIIMIRIFGIGREKKVKIPEGTNIFSIEPRVNLGSILEFDSKKSVRNMKIGYLDAKRFLYNLKGKIYYIEENEEECYYLRQLVSIDSSVKKEVVKSYLPETEDERMERAFVEEVLSAVAEELKLSREWTYKELYLSVLEATSKILRIPKYKIYKVEELVEIVRKRISKFSKEDKIPSFAYIVLNQTWMKEEVKDEFERT